jgi:hypothetical protein
VHGDGGAPAARGGVPARRSAGPRGADAAGQQVPAFTDAGDLRVCSTRTTASGRHGLLRRRTPLLIVVPYQGRLPPSSPERAPAGDRRRRPLPCTTRSTRWWLPSLASCGRPRHSELLLLPQATFTTTTCCWNAPHQSHAAGEVLYSSKYLSWNLFLSFMWCSSREIV